MAEQDFRANRRPDALPAARDIDEPFEAELRRIGLLGIDELRGLWRTTFTRPAPTGLSRDMLARMIIHRQQEQRLGALDPTIRKILARLATGHREPFRRIKVGSVIVREFRSTLHEVTVVPGGFMWRGSIHASLSSIARAITGTAWNGPRFFGLRGKGKIGDVGDAVETGGVDAVRHRPRGSVRPSRNAISRSSIGKACDEDYR